MSRVLAFFRQYLQTHKNLVFLLTKEHEMMTVLDIHFTYRFCRSDHWVSVAGNRDRIG